MAKIKALVFEDRWVADNFLSREKNIVRGSVNNLLHDNTCEESNSEMGS